MVSSFKSLLVSCPVIRWSKSIYSQSALLVFERIFAKKKMLTIWEKTSFLSGYFLVYYLPGEHAFRTSEESIMSVVDREIAYVRDLIIADREKTSKKFRDELEELIKQQQRLQTMAILFCQYPTQREMKISFFGLKNQVYLAKKQIKMLVHKHQLRTSRTGLDLTQVNLYLNFAFSFSSGIYFLA